jgi:hypothetical protein
MNCGSKLPLTNYLVDMISPAVGKQQVANEEKKVNSTSDKPARLRLKSKTSSFASTADSRATNVSADDKKPNAGQGNDVAIESVSLRKNMIETKHDAPKQVPAAVLSVKSNLFSGYLFQVEGFSEEKVSRVPH